MSLNAIYIISVPFTYLINHKFGYIIKVSVASLSAQFQKVMSNKRNAHFAERGVRSNLRQMSAVH